MAALAALDDLPFSRISVTAFEVWVSVELIKACTATGGCLEGREGELLIQPVAKV